MFNGPFCVINEEAGEIFYDKLIQAWGITLLKIYQVLKGKNY
jgi:hypothetical protein